MYKEKITENEQLIVLIPEVIPKEIKRFKPIRTGDENSRYCSRKKLAKRLITKILPNGKVKSRGTETVKAWIKLLLKYVPNFHHFYKSEKLLNDYVIWCIEQIHEEDLTLPERGRGNPEIIEDFVKFNTQLFSPQRYKEILNNEYAKEQPIENAKLSKVA